MSGWEHALSGLTLLFSLADFAVVCNVCLDVNGVAARFVSFMLLSLGVKINLRDLPTIFTRDAIFFPAYRPRRKRTLFFVERGLFFSTERESKSISGR